MSRRTTLPELAFGILKDRHATRRFLLRGRATVQAAWALLATTYNRHTLARHWRAASRLRPTVAA